MMTEINDSEQLKPTSEEELGGADIMETANVIGTDEVDLLIGTDEIDTINGGEGSDVISGRGSNDILNGEEGADLIAGGAGSDVLTGGPAVDVYIGGSGSDIFVLEKQIDPMDPNDLDPDIADDFRTIEGDRFQLPPDVNFEDLSFQLNPAFGLENTLIQVPFQDAEETIALVVGVSPNEMNQPELFID